MTLFYLYTVAMRFQASTDFLGLTLELELVTTAEEDRMLGVRGLSLDMIPEKTLQDALGKHFSKHTGYKAEECQIINEIGYLTFEDPRG